MATYVAPLPADWAPVLTAEMSDVVERTLARARPEH
jgi:hypothetical protein